MSGDEHEIIRPPNTLKSKVTYGPGGVDLDALEKAEAVIAGLKGSYLEWVQDDLVKLQEVYDRALAGQGDPRDNLREIFRIAHDIKGQGGSFDYHLMTQVGNHLCRFIEAAEELVVTGKSELAVVKVHLDALRLIIAERREGDGGAEGQKMVAGLALVVEKYLKRKKAAEEG
ncbi:Hpt domain-containing protein [Telmatospirillum sp. J64-1]|uniref:Hpt domain-containing protein n=1 Tax=Telmatospirillum sp. J64-1 TaxID=2502183 RepID=UPI00115E7CE0|nr:Hpt domain-containing protein [Telmatospirillum sp. J64-1]